MSKPNNNRISQAEFKGSVLTSLKNLEKKSDNFVRFMNDHEHRIATNEKCVAVLQNKMGTLAILQAGLTVIASTVAGYLGIKK